MNVYRLAVLMGVGLGFSCAVPDNGPLPQDRNSGPAQVGGMAGVAGGGFAGSSSDAGGTSAAGGQAGAAASGGADAGPPAGGSGGGGGSAGAGAGGSGSSGGSAGAGGASSAWNALPAAPIAGRNEFASAWSGSEWYVFGGYGHFSPPIYRNDGARYDPATATWTAIPALPAGLMGRSRLVGVWAGDEFVFWGGYSNDPDLAIYGDGARFDPASNQWTAIAAGGPSPRYGHALAYDSGSDSLIVWGGYDGSPLDDGARYSLTTGQWTPLPASPLAARWQFAYAWDATRRWLYVWGGAGKGSLPGDGAIYDAAKNSWSPLPSQGAPQGRYDLTAVVASGRLVVWGGTAAGKLLADGALFDPVAGNWAPINAPIPGRAAFSATSDGKRVFLHGGQGTGGQLDDGAIFDPVSGNWTAVAPSGLEPRRRHSSVWTPQGVLVWGGYGSVSANPKGYYKNDGASFVP